MAFRPDPPQQLEVISQREAQLRKTGYTSDGKPAPEAAMVDMDTPPVVAAPSTPSPKPTRFVPDAPAAPPPAPKADPIGEANAAAQAKEQGPVQDTLDMLTSGFKHIPAALSAMVDAAVGRHLGTAPREPDIAGNFRSAVHTITNPTETLSSIGTTLRNATPEQVGANVVAPLLAGGAVSKIAGLAGGGAAAADAPAAVVKYGMRTGEGSPIARNVAGSSAKPAVTAHNQAMADPVLGAQAGVPVGTKISPTTLEAGREAPNSVYQRAAENIPTGPLSPNAAQAVQGVGADDMIVHSPDTQATIDAQKARLLQGPLTGSQVVDAQKALRFNGFRGVGSEDPEQIAVGRAQLKMADALHQHMVDTLPENAPVTADQLSAARVALAQNHTIENVLGPNGNVNLTKLAKLHNDNPGMLSGPMQEIAQFASDHPEVTRLPSDAERFNPPGIIKDIASVNPLERPVGSIAQLFGGAVARRTLTGPAIPARVPVTGLGGEFGPVAPRQPGPLTLTPPLGRALEPFQPDLAASAGPYQPPYGMGAPVRPVAPGTHELSLADSLTGAAPANNSDLASVLSQGVPEDILMRTPKNPGLKMKVAHNPALKK